MEKLDLFRDIIERTGGDIYIGAVGPVRSGKSTFVTFYAAALLIWKKGPNGSCFDELPMSGTDVRPSTEPKFIPEDAVKWS